MTEKILEIIANKAYVNGNDISVLAGVSINTGYKIRDKIIKKYPKRKFLYKRLPIDLVIKELGINVKKLKEYAEICK